jgi:hypothetical protein
MTGTSVSKCIVSQAGIAITNHARNVFVVAGGVVVALIILIRMT